MGFTCSMANRTACLVLSSHEIKLGSDGSSISSDKKNAFKSSVDKSEPISEAVSSKRLKSLHAEPIRSLKLATNCFRSRFKIEEVKNGNRHHIHLMFSE